MLDFLMISSRTTSKGVLEIFPRFKLYPQSHDLMIRGGDFYAVWVEDRGLWSINEQDALVMIDKEMDIYADKQRDKFAGTIRVLHMWDSESGSIDSWHRYCQKQMRDSFHTLDETLIFSNTEVKKEDYASKKLNYPLVKGDTPAWNTIIGTLYSEKERHKIEWAIGSVVSGESKQLQKFMVLYGAAGTGKSTILNIIQQLFEGYYSVFDAKALGSNGNSFALEAFKSNPLVAIQHDGDLSKIEDNTRLNSLVSHELMTVNEKFKSTYANQFKCFLFMGTNKPVKITDGKSGLIRRLIDVSPTGIKLTAKDYRITTKQITFELGAIAWHCREVYLENPDAYDDYMPLDMLGASNDFYNYVIDAYSMFVNEDGVTLKAAWERYKTFCDDTKVPFPYSQRNFKEELKNYFWEFNDRVSADGTRIRNYYKGFRKDKFDTELNDDIKISVDEKTIDFKEQKSIFDMECSDYPAQYASSTETPTKKWTEVTETLKEINSSQIHYVKVPENHIVIDFDIKGPDGTKSFDKNLEAASKWPSTYAELSKSGSGIHLHYIYSGDISKLSRIYDDDIEIKVFTGNGSLRRRLTKCNDKPIATISSGLPMRGEKAVINFDGVVTEKHIRTMIKRNLNKEVHPSTKSSVDFIFKILDDAYKNDVTYDVTDMKNAVLAFAAASTHQAQKCLKLVQQMKFKSEEPSVNVDSKQDGLVFYDIEVFPNLFLVNWKMEGEGKPVVRMINPTSSEIEELIKFKLVGFNCRRYDNHLLYARLMGYDNEQIYNLSQKIISSQKGDKNNGMFGEAYNISYTDVYDFASAGNKKSLKKLEIEMGIHHQELGLPWDQPVPEELWTKVAEYCDNDVIATEAAFNYLKADWTARQILADLAGMTVNDTTNSLTTRFIFGKNRTPQNEFRYRDMSKPIYQDELDAEALTFLNEACPEMMSCSHGNNQSVLPYFPGYTYDKFGKKSIYRDEEVGEGGYVYAEPGMYYNVALLDIASMHPHSLIAECHFGPRFTQAFSDIVEGRVEIKHESWDAVNKMLDGKLTPYVQKVINGEMKTKDLANALKTAINSVYGLTSASFPNPFRDPRNDDNIVAKRGALFMIDLKHAVQEKGFTVAHIKTDSIKIPNATPEVIQFVMEFGKRYGYTFEHEATYDKMCLVNNAVYICYHDGEWDATGKQFAVPYVFKTLFSKEQITFNDMCETFAVSKGDLYLDMNENLPDVSVEEKELKFLDKHYKEGKLSEKPYLIMLEQCKEKIAKGHDLNFVGRVGQFTPIKAGCGGGVLYRVNDGKNYAAPGSDGYHWLESEMVKELCKEEDIDKSFYKKLVDDAVKVISEYGDFEQFSSNDPVPPVGKMPCGKLTCAGCEHLSEDNVYPDLIDCNLGLCILEYAKSVGKDTVPF